MGLTCYGSMWAYIKPDPGLNCTSGVAQLVRAYLSVGSCKFVTITVERKLLHTRKYIHT